MVPINVSRETVVKSEPGERARGRMTIHVLTRADLPTLQGEDDALIVGSRVAVIDLQVFVPEVVSVLSALNDKMMDSSLQHISFTHQLLGSVTENADIDIIQDDESVETVI